MKHIDEVLDVTAQSNLAIVYIPLPWQSSPYDSGAKWLVERHQELGNTPVPVFVFDAEHAPGESAHAAITAAIAAGIDKPILVCRKPLPPPEWCDEFEEWIEFNTHQYMYCSYPIAKWIPVVL